jgi:hypothetical protein
LEVRAGETAQTWEQDARAAGEVRESIGGVDEPCLDRMLRVFQDVPTGSLGSEDGADDRTVAPWNAVGEARLKARGTAGWSLVSDRAKAWMQRAEKGVACLSLPDCLPCRPALGQRSALAIGQRVRQARQERTQAQEVLARRQGQSPAAHDAPQAQAVVEARQGRGDALGRGAPHLSGPLGAPLAPAAPMQPLGLRSPNRRPGSTPTACGGGGDRRLRPAPSVGGPSRHQDHGPTAGACPRRPGRLLVARRPARCGACSRSPLGSPWGHECVLPLV